MNRIFILFKIFILISNKVFIIFVQIPIIAFFSNDDHYDKVVNVDHMYFGTRSYAALRAADLHWIVGPGYSSGEYFLECTQCLAP